MLHSLQLSKRINRTRVRRNRRCHEKLQPVTTLLFYTLHLPAMAVNTAHIGALVKKDLLLELRQQYTFYGVLLYVASTIFVIYLSVGQPEEQVWNSLFWIVQLFVCVNAVAKSFFAGK